MATTDRDREDPFAEVESLWQNGDWSRFDERVERIHIARHDDGPVHLRVHVWRLRRAVQQRRWSRVALEMLGIPFVVPTSLAQRLLGLALPSRKNQTPS